VSDIPLDCQPSRRLFMQTATGAVASAMAATSLSAFSIPPQAPTVPPGLNIIGPKEGYSSQIGTLVSELTRMRYFVLQSVQGMPQKDLDFLLDDKANRIGALLLHLVAAERLYQANTFDNVPIEKLSEDWKSKWEVPMDLGEPARKTIVGHDIDYYLNLLHETREHSLAEFRKRDDKWLMSIDKTWDGAPTNNYCKWFHVCEHESHHNGQILLLKNRLPGSKPSE
jgi:uncharacterized damage-inducible protein DinB